MRQQVNINTASREVLRSMIAGVILDQDPIAPHVVPKKINQVGDANLKLYKYYL